MVVYNRRSLSRGGGSGRFDCITFDTIHKQTYSHHPQVREVWKTKEIVWKFLLAGIIPVNNTLLFISDFFPDIFSICFHV